ncbi:hypothetical protein [Nocardia sp. NPDC057353]|uniref:hypothetical protein n=1 Tax=Nocardia sp. NPDC057353 TaxID=3346104 RepID=UPI003632F021
MKVEIGELQRLLSEVRRAQSSLDHGVQLFGGGRTAMPRRISVGNGGPFPVAEIPVGNRNPFGNTAAGKTLVSTHASTYGSGEQALGAFARTVDADGERLELAILLYRTMDADNAENLLAQNRNGLRVLSTHLTVDSDGHEQDQVGQINTLIDLAGGPDQGNTLVNGDFNTNRDRDYPGAHAIDGFTAQGFDPDAGRIADGQGGTSASNLPIDYVMPRGVATSDAERWDRDFSDHDGQRADVTLPAW